MSIGWSFGGRVVGGWLVMLSLWPGGGQDPAPQDDLLRAVEAADPAAAVLLERIPAASRDAEWHYLAALVALSAGEEEMARRHAAESTARGSVRSWLLEGMLRVQHGEAPRTLDDAPAGWRRNGSLRIELAREQWASRHLGERHPELSGLSEVLFFGSWPPPLPDDDAFDLHEPRDPTQRLRWYNEGSGNLLRRLTGAPTRRIFSRPERRGRWVLVTLLRDGDPFRERLAECERLWSHLPGAPLVFLWLVENPRAAGEARLERVIGSPRLPLFVAHLGESRRFAVPGFERGGVSLLIDDQMRLRMVVAPALPLAVLAKTTDRLLSGSDDRR